MIQMAQVLRLFDKIDEELKTRKLKIKIAWLVAGSRYNRGAGHGMIARSSRRLMIIWILIIRESWWRRPWSAPVGHPPGVASGDQVGTQLLGILQNAASLFV